ncbi:hypothetical protein BDZ91DRAFT_852877 [Kalaharituber pfeilii]|nr:hypothetical protein BDZ91DRAFT_852877 [Kalaharituber pfeilii]
MPALEYQQQRGEQYTLGGAAAADRIIFFYILNGTAVTLDATHGSEVPVLFGTVAQLGSPARLQLAVLKYLQSMWVAFAVDTENELSQAPFELPEFDGALLGQTSVLLAREGEGGKTAELGCEGNWD